MKLPASEIRWGRRSLGYGKFGSRSIASCEGFCRKPHLRQFIDILVSSPCSSPRHKMWNHVSAAKKILKRVGLAALLIGSSFSLAAQQDSQSMIAAIKAEGLRSTEARVVFHTLTDTIG